MKFDHGKYFLLFACLISCLPAFAEFEDGQKITFMVRNPENNECHFLGDEHIEVRDGVVRKTTRYLDEAGLVVQKERSVYELDSLRLLTYTFDNVQTGEQVRLRTDGDVAHIRSREGAASRWRTGRVVWRPGMYMAKPLHHLILRNWQGLIAGENFRFDLMVPFKMNSYNFRIRYVETVDRGGQRLHLMRLEPESWILRGLVAPMDFYYSDGRQLVLYEGVSTAAVNGDPKAMVRIDFAYDMTGSPRSDKQAMPMPSPSKRRDGVSRSDR